VLRDVVMVAPPCLLLTLLAVGEPPMLRRLRVPRRDNVGRW
jgi:hypothetical protein